MGEDSSQHRRTKVAGEPLDSREVQKARELEKKYFKKVGVSERLTGQQA